LVNKRNVSLAVIPLDNATGGGRSIQRNHRKTDSSLNALLEDLAYAVSQNKLRDELYEDSDEEGYSDESTGEFSDSSDLEAEDIREEETSDSDNESGK